MKEIVRPPEGEITRKPIQLALSFLPSDVRLLKEAAQKYGDAADQFICFDDLGARDPFTSLTVIADNLSEEARADIGVMGAAIPRLNATDSLVSFATAVHDLRQGHRVTLGLVPGAWMETLGLKSATVGDVREAVESLRYFLQGRTDGYSGRRFHVESGFKLGYQPIPEGQVEIFIGAFGPQMLRLAGQVADGIKLGGSTNPDMVAIAKERLAVGAKEVGRNVDEITISMGAVTVVDHDRDVAIRKAKELAVVYINVIGERDVTEKARQYTNEIAAIKEAMARGDTEGAIACLSDDLLKLFAFVGTPEDVAKQASSLYEAGATRIEFGPPHGTQELEGVRMLAEEVFPLIRERVGSMGFVQ